MRTLRASSAYSWMHCSLVGTIIERGVGLPDEETDAAREGTCAAWVAEVIINGDATCVEDMVGKVHRNGWEVDETMARHIDGYLRIFDDRHGARSEVAMRQVSYNTAIAGTADAVSYLPDGTLCIDDLKYGYGPHDVIEHWQLLVYLALASTAGYGLTDHVQLGIYQPRLIHPHGVYRTWRLTRAEAESYIERIIERVREIAEQPPLARCGNHCSHCPGAAVCDALAQSVYAMWEPIESRTYTVPTNQQIADELDMLDRMGKMLTARRAAVEAEAEQRMAAQQMIPGWGKVPRKGKRTFTIPGEAVHAMTGVDPWDEPKLCTPAELERRGASKEIVAAITTTPTIGYKLDRYDEKLIANLFK